MKYQLRLQRIIRTGEEDVEPAFIDTVELDKLPGDHIFEYPGKEGYYKILGSSILSTDPVVDTSRPRYTLSSGQEYEYVAGRYVPVEAKDLDITKSNLVPSETHNAEYYLKTAQEAMRARAQLRDKPTGERSMESTVASFNALTGHSLTEQEGWEFMVLLKMVRGRQGKFHADDYCDGSAYFALLGEANARQRGG